MIKTFCIKISRPIAVLSLLVSPVLTGFASELSRPSKDRFPVFANYILDESKPVADREKFIAEVCEDPMDSAPLIDELTKDLDSKPDTKEEYRRIPWIWRIAVAAGKRNQAKELFWILESSLPDEGQTLRDWQAVVVGGGVINGIGLVGGWPAERVGSIVAGTRLHKRWEQIQDQAAVMAEDEKVFKGTRYDAIRILGVGTWDRRGAQIFKYLLRGVDDELQMGAISALGDMKAPGVGQSLLSGMTFYSAKNREMALDALIREDSRVRELLFAVEEGRVSLAQLGEARIAKLRLVADPDLRARAEKVLGAK